MITTNDLRIPTNYPYTIHVMQALGCFRDNKHDRALSVTPPKCDEGERSMSVEVGLRPLSIHIEPETTLYTAALVGADGLTLAL